MAEIFTVAEIRWGAGRDPRGKAPANFCGGAGDRYRGLWTTAIGASRLPRGGPHCGRLLSATPFRDVLADGEAPRSPPKDALASARVAGDRNCRERHLVVAEDDRPTTRELRAVGSWCRGVCACHSVRCRSTREPDNAPRAAATRLECCG